MSDNNNRTHLAWEDEVCSFCKKSLSVSPIYSNGNAFICGRCDVTKCAPDNVHSYTRQYLYERVGHRRLFSCPHRIHGCKAELKWGQVDEHQSNCIYRRIRCPLFHADIFPKISKACEWTGRGSEVCQHIEKWHHDYIADPPVFSVSKSNLIFFTHFNNVLFTVIVIFAEPKTYKVCVLTVGTPREITIFRYQLQIYNESKTDSVIIRQNKILSLHSLGSVLRNHDLLFHVDMNNFEHLLGNPKSLVGKLALAKKTKSELRNSMPDLERSMLGLLKRERMNPINETLLQELECPICSEYMVPPIYICSSGHSMCKTCVPRLHRCPTCQGSLTGARNFTLEKLTTRVNYPCHNRSLGCFYVSSSDTIALHQQNCPYSGRQCVLKCNWKGNNEEMKAHIRTEHKDNILDMSNVHTLDIGTVITQRFHVIFYEDEMFRVAIQNSTEQKLLKMNVQHLSMQDVVEFKYDLQFLDVLDNGINCSITYLCKELTRAPRDMFNDSVIVSTDFLKAFAIDNVIQYKITIRPKEV